MLRFHKGSNVLFFLFVVSGFYLHPGIFKSLSVAAHLPHDIVHINISLSSFIGWHELQSQAYARFSCLSCLFLSSNILTKAFGLSNAQQQKYDCKVTPRVGIAALGIEVELAILDHRISSVFWVYRFQWGRIKDSKVTFSCLTVLVVCTKAVSCIIIDMGID